MHELIDQNLDVDLSGLRLLRLVAGRRSIVEASKDANLSASALSRQIQAIEGRLGFQVFERTTRVLELTEAGGVLLRETQAIPHILRSALRKVRETGNIEIKVGISTGLSFAHIAGIFHSHQRRGGEGKLVISQLTGDEVLHAVERAQ